MLRYNLKSIFRERGIDRPLAFMVNAGIASTTAHDIMNNNVRTFRLKHIEILCKALMCEPNDLLVWTPKKGEIYPDDLPLRKLEKKTAESDEFMDLLSKLTLSDLREVAKEVVDKRKGS